MGEDNVHAALSLVGYEPELRKAMEYVFGSTLVCDTLDNAKKVAFEKQVLTKTVTLGGDIFDPQGTLSGGESNEEAHTHTHTRAVSKHFQVLAQLHVCLVSERCSQKSHFWFGTKIMSLLSWRTPLQTFCSSLFFFFSQALVHSLRRS